MTTAMIKADPVSVSSLIKADPVAVHDEVAMELSYRTMRHFVRYAWPAIEGRKPFISGWHIDCICEHLEAVFHRDLTRLIINIPPRHMKSTSASVAFPAWCWLHDPAEQFLLASYAHNLSIRDNVKCRRIIQSRFYQSLLDLAADRSPEVFYHGRLELEGDQNAKERYQNNYTGYRLATSVDGAATGEGGSIILIDDANNIKDTESETKRNAVNVWFDEVMQTRLNDPSNDAFVIIQQRTHESDLTGHILETYGDEYTHLVLPARFEHEKPVSIGFHGLPWWDEREEVGEPLWPERFSDKVLTSLEKVLGPYAAAGQLQQRPSPRKGSMFDSSEFVVTKADLGNKVVRRVRYWDKAGTDSKKNKNAAYTAGVLVAKLRNGRFWIEDVVRGQWNATERERRIRQTAEMDGQSVRIFIEQEPGSGGKESAEISIRGLAGFIIKADRPTGDKAVRAEPFSIQVNGGNVYVKDAEWTQDFIGEFTNFPVGKFKDQVDSASAGFNKLALSKGMQGVVWAED